MENAHEAIIPREVFYKVQEELHLRANIYKKSSKKETESKGKHSGKYALSKITICKECGCEYRRQIWSMYGVKESSMEMRKQAEKWGKILQGFANHRGKRIT